MDTKLKNIKFKDTVIYILIALVTSTLILSILEARDNLKYIIPGSVYSQTEVADDIQTFNQLVKDYCFYYKSEDYTKDKANITQDDIDICKADLKNKIEEEYNEFRNSKYNYEGSFNSLEYEEQQKILEEGRKKIEEKYTLTDDEMTKYILERKLNSFNSLRNSLKAYSNLQFAAFDKEADKWIGDNEKDLTAIKSNSRYFEEINIDFNNNVIEKVFINGTEQKDKGFFNSAIKDYVYKNSYKYYYYDYNQKDIYSDSNEKHNITIYIWIPADIKAGDVVYESLQNVYKNERYFAMNIVVIISTLIALIVLLYMIKKRKNNIEAIDKIINILKGYPIEYKGGALIISIFIWKMFCYRWYTYAYVKRVTFTSVIWGAIIIALWYIVIKVLYLNYKEGTLLKDNLSSKVYNYIAEVMKRGSILKSIVIISVIYVVAGLTLLLFAVAMDYMFPIFFIAGVIMTIAFIVLVIRNLVYLDEIMIGAKDASEGKLNYTIKEKGNGHLKGLAHSINNIKEGLRESIQKEMKSENMKTELITNVSHDLKTPLTSIINYIDLLKREDIEPEAARDYVNVLDKKSQRLKVLIEDLFEASKAASGAMELNITKIDIVQLLKQALGENDERFKESNLDVKLNIPNEKIFINGDGQRIYRVFENLISNIVKYSLSNTRVYIDMIKNEKSITIVMKNISSYELSFDTNDITNRFKRGDEARSTEGSGLGLAIAKSIIELHQGQFNIEVDGDLFKSITILNL